MKSDEGRAAVSLSVETATAVENVALAFWSRSYLIL
jgi:hypothetical protein